MKKWLLLTGLMLFFCSSSYSAWKMRLISLVPSVTEILFALELDEEIVGVTTFCDYPEAALKKDKIGSFSQPDLERILSLNPDMVFVTDLEQAILIEKLKQLGLNVYVCSPATIEEILIEIENIGEITGKISQAKRLVKEMRSKIQNIEGKVRFIPEDKKQKVFIEIWHEPLMTAGKGSFVDELIYLAGGINIAKDVYRPYSYFSAEQVIKRNPDCIILGYMSQDMTGITVATRIGWSDINAVKNKRIYNDIKTPLFLRPGPRIVEGLIQIHRRLYP